jgi:hypothetical protein
MRPPLLLGHALRKALGVIARQQGRGLRAMAAEAGASLVAGPSIKAALDLDWDDPSAQQHALTRILDELHAVEHWLDTHPAPAAVAPQVAASLAVAEQVRTQDITAAPNGTPTLQRGVSASKMPRCAMGGRAGVCWWMATNARYGATWTRA